MTAPNMSITTADDGFVFVMRLAEHAQLAEYIMSDQCALCAQDIERMEACIAGMRDALSHPCMSNPCHDLSSFMATLDRATAWLESARKGAISC